MTHDDAVLSRWPVRRVEASPSAQPPAPDAWPATVPAVAQLLRDGLDLRGATVLVGENGTGKSTLVEAIATAYGLNPEGGSVHARHRTHDSESGLDAALRIVRGAGASRWGYFVRAETMHGFFTYSVENNGPDFHRMSHGEAFRELVLGTTWFDGPGFYVFDEPESALSFSGQLALLGQLADLAGSGAAQILLATHSPVLAALPDAAVYELDESGYARREWADLEMVGHYRSYLDDPRRYLRHLLD